MNNPPTIQKIPTPAGKYYVYTLARPDGTVFYVGKGKNDRVDHHEKEAARHCGCPKCCVIRSVWEESGAVVKSIVFETKSEAEAFKHERAMILADQASLCNRSKGCAGRAQPIRPNDKPLRDPWELYDAMRLECQREIRELDDRRRRAIGYERYTLRAEVKQKKVLLATWIEQSKRFKRELQAYCKEVGIVDRKLRRPHKPW